MLFYLIILIVAIIAYKLINTNEGFVADSDFVPDPRYVKIPPHLTTTEVIVPKIEVQKIPELYKLPGHTRHAKLNDFNGVEYVDDKPPCARGDFGCRVVNCPAVFEDGVICWKCNDYVVEPQYTSGTSVYYIK